MRSQKKEIEKAFWENGLKQWTPAILAVSPFLLAELWFTFLSMKQWSWCETALQITRTKSMHPFMILQLKILVEWKIEEKEFFLFNWHLLWKLGNGAISSGIALADVVAHGLNAPGSEGRLFP